MAIGVDTINPHRHSPAFGTAPGPMTPALWRVISRRRETYDTVTLTAVPPRGSAPFHFKAGQFNMLYVFGVGEVPISISGDPVSSEALVHTLRSVGPVTDALAKLKPGK